MWHRVIYMVVFLCVIILFLFHGSQGSVTYLLRKLPSKPSYILPFARRILLPITSGTPSNSNEMELQLSRMIAPSMLAPHEPAQKGYMKSPSPTTTPLSPIGERTPIGYHAKSPTTNAPIPVSLPKAPSHHRKIFPKKSRRRPRASPPLVQGPLSPIQSPFSPTVKQGATAPTPSLMVPSSSGPILPPSFSPSGSFIMNPRKSIPSPVRALPPPPPSEDCISVPCMEPLTNTPPGSPCGCVLPMQVGLRLGVSLYTFFPLVSDLAQEIAAGIFVKQNQVRIMGANADSQRPDMTMVLVDLLPLGEKFDNNTVFFTYEKFWHKQVVIKTNFFGDYEVVYVRYPGLPPSPPLAPPNITVEDGPLSNGNNGRMIHPLGVDPRKRRERLSSSLIVIMVLSSTIVLFLCLGAAWLLFLKRGDYTSLPAPTPQTSLPIGKPSVGVGPMLFSSDRTSASISFSYNIATYTVSAKTFSICEIQRATDSFDDSRILGEGGFGRVYSGILEDGTKVAVKVLKRDDQQGGREFLAEVEMLSRLHHRNLVKLIGICIEEHSRCLVYELIPNGSVESHLHGVDKETAPLDWSARMKIALGSARGLAYLHEDSSPRVIHRDFKSSNILLEHDFTPKVSDFGLARTALEGGNEHISTRVMGTFGYVAPEYAMTGHLLVKSDVYSYGVVLLELLTGRKPVDMSQPQGQENVVTWARPLLTSKDGLETIIDQALGPHFPFDSVAKVAAIASMCVQPEVSHRPFMGEVVQALKLVCNENDEKKQGSGSCSQDDYSILEMETKINNDKVQLPEMETRNFRTDGLEPERELSTSEKESDRK
ncbi:protein kinase superfamily protein isoform X3 [Tasmannia lanceolata]|uniref:protein kinase superfamily protein isoform X3 n=1 Tax=Tasmannia lanceolata TaxID=3420 RepID=UPI0040632BFE